MEIHSILTVDKIKEIISKIPEDWLLSDTDNMSHNEMRSAYLDYINAKLSMMDTLVKEAEDAR